MACLVGLLTSARVSHASSDPYLGLALLVWAGVVIVAPIGAMVTSLEGEPSKEWGRTSLVTGSIASAAGTGVLIAGAFAEESERSAFNVIGGITLGIGLNGVLWGIVTEATLPEEDPGIAGQQRPPSMPTTFTLEGRF